MPTFAYRAIDRAGARHAGRTDAVSADGAARALEQRGLVVIDVTEAESPRTTGRSGRHRQAVLAVTRSLAALLPAGLPLARALRTAAAADPAMREVLDDVRSRVERGDALSAALGGHPEYFTAVHVGVIRSGERSGDLAGAFQRLAVQLEREDEVRARLLTTLVYPTLLAVFGGVAVTVLMFVVLPRFAGLLQDTGAALPRSTSALLAVATGLQDGWPWIAGALAAAAAGVVALHSAGLLQRPLARAMLALPVVGALRRELLSARLARLTGVMLRSGAPALAALDVAAESIGDVVAADEVAAARALVREGTPLHQALRGGTVWVPVLPELVAVGEASGQLAEFLGKAAEILEQRTERALARAVALVEPLLIVLFGGVIGVVALSLLQAIYGLNAGGLR